MPVRFDPGNYGTHGILMDTIANACEDIGNGIPFDATEDNDLLDLILNHAHVADSTLSEEIPLPDAPTLREAMAGSERAKWLEAIHDKLCAIKEAGTWTLVDCTPAIQNVVGCRFVLQKKHGEDGQVTKFKARLVAQGFSQREGIDFSETFAPVVKSSSL